MNEFEKWNIIKQERNDKETFVGYKEREIFYITMGHNVGYEQNGKGMQFIRPIVVLKGFNRSMFLGVPLSSQIKNGIYYYSFQFKKSNQTINNIALLSQIRTFSTKRLLHKIGVMQKEDFLELKEKIKYMIN